MRINKVIALVILSAVFMYACNTQPSETEGTTSEEVTEEAAEAMDDAADAVDEAIDDAAVQTENAAANKMEAEGAQNFYLDPEGNVVYTFLTEENMPRFTDGDLNEYLKENLKYPIKSRENGSEGTVVVNFIVSSDGAVHGAKVVKATDDELLNAEALRVVQEMPNWTPGMQDGKAVSYQYNLPVAFRLKQ